MLNVLSKIFGGGKIIEEGFKLIDSIHTSDQEEIEAKAKAKVDLLGAYAPFKLAQRYLAIMFTVVFLFIMVNGIVGSLYGWIDMSNVQEAKDFASSMWLGEIMLAIIGFYFGGGFADSIKRNKQ
jgi:hypothetical protein